MAAKEKVYDILPERAVNIKIERQNDDWNKTNFYHNSFNRSRLDLIINAIMELVDSKNAIYDSNKNYYMFKDCASGYIIDHLTSTIENLSQKELYYYCAFTDINGDVFIRINI